MQHESICFSWLWAISRLSIGFGLKWKVVQPKKLVPNRRAPSTLVYKRVHVLNTITRTLSLGGAKHIMNALRCKAIYHRVCLPRLCQCHDVPSPQDSSHRLVSHREPFGALSAHTSHDHVTYVYIIPLRGLIAPQGFVSIQAYTDISVPAQLLLTVN
jgi:hypothetical protein